MSEIFVKKDFLIDSDRQFAKVHPKNVCKLFTRETLSDTLKLCEYISCKMFDTFCSLNRPTLKIKKVILILPTDPPVKQLIKFA